MFGNTKETIKKMLEEIQQLERRITVLENAAQCAAGNHVWEMRCRYVNLGDAALAMFTPMRMQAPTEVYIGCKHCGTPKDKTNESA